jgi:hypothetical protein
VLGEGRREFAAATPCSRRTPDSPATASELTFSVPFGEPVARDERLQIVDIAAAHAVDEHLRRQNDGQNVLMLCRIAVNAPRVTCIHCAVHDGYPLGCAPELT